MWTTENRAKYDRDRLRYPSDLTDTEWALVEPLIPPAKHGGRDREVDVREVVNGIMYVLSTEISRARVAYRCLRSQNDPIHKGRGSTFQWVMTSGPCSLNSTRGACRMDYWHRGLFPAILRINGIVSVRPGSYRVFRVG